MSDTKSVRVVIRGKVQGVFFRAWTKERADHHGIAGWVRNRADGAVEGVLSGPAPAVDAVLGECRRGPPAARVDDVAVEATEPPSTHGFEIRD